MHTPHEKQTTLVNIGFPWRVCLHEKAGLETQEQIKKTLIKQTIIK
jgi:hypothetical protein